MKIVPDKASTIANFFDAVNLGVFLASLFFTVAICGTMVWFAFKYKAGRQTQTPRIYGNNTLEIIWTVVPTVVVIILGILGVYLREKMFEIQPNSLTINVVGWKWAWEFQYPNGKKTSGQNAELVVPLGQPVKLIVTSKDVLHSFFIPAMRVKQDAVPGQYKYLTFTPTKVGEFPVFCTEYCGTRHSLMLARLKVVPEQEFKVWLESKPSTQVSPVFLGRKLYSDLGCNACHSLKEGERLVGPSFYGLKGSVREIKGQKVEVDENYVRESILYPNQFVVEGFQANLMPSYLGRLSDEELNALVYFVLNFLEAPSEELVKVSLEKEAKIDLASLSPVERGKILYEQKACIGCHSLDGSKLVGPSFKNLYGSQRKFQDGTSAVADEEYLKASILYPNKNIVEGYVAAMPSYEGQLSDEELNDIIEFIKAQK
jgi:cytochrome c oxidase subunit 2